MIESMDNTLKCVICGSNEWSTTYQKNHEFTLKDVDFRFNQEIIVCKNCGCTRVVLNEDYADEQLDRYYRMTLRTPARLSVVCKDKEDPRVKNARARADFIKRNTEGQDLLEIGFGDGFTLLECANNGYNCAGVDLTGDYDENIGYLQDKGLDIVNESFENFLPQKRYDVISAFLLLEHIKHPETLIEKVHGCLNEEGYAVIEVPDVANYQYFYSESQLTFEHIYHYTIGSLERLMNKHGFELVGYESPGAGYAFALTASFRKTSQPTPHIERIDESDNVLQHFEDYFRSMADYKAVIRGIFEDIIMKHRSIVIFGVGYYFDSLRSIIGPELLEHTEFYLDETKEKIGSVLHDRVVHSLEALQKQAPKAVVIASEIFARKIEERIRVLSPNTEYYCIQDMALDKLNEELC